MTIFALYLLAGAVGYYTILLLWDFRLARRQRENSERLAALLAEFAALKSEIAALPVLDHVNADGSGVLRWPDVTTDDDGDWIYDCKPDDTSPDCDCNTCRSYYQATDQV